MNYKVQKLYAFLFASMISSMVQAANVEVLERNPRTGISLIRHGNTVMGVQRIAGYIITRTDAVDESGKRHILASIYRERWFWRSPVLVAKKRFYDPSDRGAITNWANQCCNLGDYVFVPISNQ